MNLKSQKRYGLILMIAGVILWAVLLFFASGSETAVMIGSFGTGLAMIGLFRVIKVSRLMGDKEKAADYERMQTDERTIYIANKARSMALYLSIMLQSVAALIAYFVFDQLRICQVLVAVNCMQCLLYYIFWIIYNKKY